MAAVIASSTKNTTVNTLTINLGLPSGSGSGERQLIIVGSSPRGDAVFQPQFDTDAAPGFTRIYTNDHPTRGHIALFERTPTDGTEASITVTAQVAQDLHGFRLRLTGSNTSGTTELSDTSQINSASYRIDDPRNVEADSLAIPFWTFNGGDGFPFEIGVITPAYTLADEHRSGTGGSNVSGGYATKIVPNAGRAGVCDVDGSSSDWWYGGMCAIPPEAGTTTVGNSLDLRRNIDQFIGQSLDLRRNITTTIGRTLDLRRRVQNLAGRSLDLRRDMQAFIGKSLDLQRDIRSNVGKTVDFRRRVQNIAGQSLDLRRSVFDFVGNTLDLRRDMDGLVGSTLDLRRNIDTNMIVGSSLDLRRNITGNVGKTLDLRRRVQSIVGQSLDLKRDMQANVGNSLDLQRDILENLGKTLDLRRSVLASVGQTLDLRRHIEGKVGSTLDLRRDIEQLGVDHVLPGIDPATFRAPQPERSLVNFSQLAALGQSSRPTFRAYSVLDLNVTADTETQLTFEGKGWDFGRLDEDGNQTGSFDINVDEMRAQITGVYGLHFNTTMEATTTHRVEFRIYVNGSKRFTDHRRTVANDLQTASFARELYLERGDMVELRAYSVGNPVTIKADRDWTGRLVNR